MANYAGIKAAIDAQIKLNGQNAITGNILNGVLNQMVDVLAEGYQLMGVATISDTPAVGDSNIAYLAGPGTYTNYGGLEVPDLCVGVLKYNGTLWSVNYTQIVDLTDYATKTYVNGLLQDAIDAAAAANAALLPCGWR